MSDPDGQLALLAERFRAAGLFVREAACFAPTGLGVFAEEVEVAPNITVADALVFIYPRDGAWELRVTQHGGPHWIRHETSMERAEEIARAFLAEPILPPGAGWTETED